MTRSFAFVCIVWKELLILQSLLLFGSALGLGAAHAFEPDHMAAVSTFVARRPSPKQAIMFGIQWAIGHGLSLLLIGSILFALKMTIAESLAGSLEKIVGVVLIGLGLWTLYQLRPGELHHTHSHHHEHDGHDHAHHHHDEHEHSAHMHADGTTHSHHGHSHGKGSLWMGMLHGAAGTAAFVGEALVAVSQTYLAVFLYTLFFSIGVLVAMALYAGALGGLIDWGGRRFRTVMVGAQALTGVLACVVGYCWVSGIEIPWIHFH
jgi:ABC-type nickel/cobalt efflux system permease component RcnA